MKKLEKKFIRLTYKKIFEVIDNYECRYHCFPLEEWSSYGISKLKEERFDEIQYFIDHARDRGVNENVINQFQRLNNALWWRIHY